MVPATHAGGDVVPARSSGAWRQPPPTRGLAPPFHINRQFLMQTQPTAGRRALITGITGQDGSYLAEFLLDRGYEVHGLVRRSSSFNTQRLDGIYRDPHEAGVRLMLHHGDLGDSGSLVNLIRDIQPNEIYHLGAQ